MTSTYTIGVDLGGTNIKGGVCDAAHQLLSQHTLPTEAPGGFEHVLGRMAQLVDELVERSGMPRDAFDAIGVGAPGPLSHARGIIHAAPNLPGFVDAPLRDRFSERTGLRVALENDANAAAYGEFVAGAASDARSMVMLTLGTGVGGGVVLDGELWRGPFDNAGEVGHMIIEPGGRPCPCGQRGCLERYASANAVAERLAEAAAGGEVCALGSKVARGEAFDARDVLAARADGDALARRIWDETCRYLALCMVNLQHLLNPEVIVLAGGLINAGDVLLSGVRSHFQTESWKIAPDHPDIRLATLGTNAGTIGAAALAHREA
jgi:glucokinase